MNMIFLGPPGAGKGTQAVIIAKRYSLPHISTGDMLRGAIADRTELGSKAKAFIDAGELVPDDVVIGIVKERLKKDDCKRGYILDGFPRTVAQAEALSGFADIDACILIDVPVDVLVRRIASRRVCKDCGAPYIATEVAGSRCEKCGGELIQRPDDNEETVRNRMEVYEKSTSPLIVYYAAKGLLFRVSGSQDLDEVTRDIVKIVER